MTSIGPIFQSIASTAAVRIIHSPAHKLDSHNTSEKKVIFEQYDSMIVSSFTYNNYTPARNIKEVRKLQLRNWP